MSHSTLSASPWLRALTALLVVFLSGASTEVASQGAVDPEPGEGSVIEFLHTRVRFESDGRGDRTLEARVRVLTDQGVREWGQLSFPYSSAFETMAFELLEVRKADGRAITPSDDAEQDSSVSLDPTAPVFSDYRHRQVALAALRPGDTVAFRVVWTVHTAPAPGEFWFAHRFSKVEKTEIEVVEVDVPDSRDVIVRTRPGQPEPSSTLADGRRVYRWESSHVPVSVAVADPPDAETVVLLADPPDLHLTTFADWRSVGAWFAAQVHPAGTPSELVRAKARELTADVSATEAKVRALFAFVATEIRYVSVSIGVGRYTARAPDEVLRTLYGDCKDKHALLAALLSAVGIEAFPALASIAARIDRDVPSPAQFDHVVTVISQGDESASSWWVDATIDTGPFGYLALPMRGQPALVASGAKRAELVDAPDRLPFGGGAVTRVTGTVNGIGALDASVEQRIRGDGEVILRAVLRPLTAQQHVEVARVAIKSAGVMGDIVEAAFSGLDRPDDPVVMSTRVRQAGFLSWAQESSHVGAALPKFDIVGETSKDWHGLDERDFHSPITIDLASELTLPPGYEARAPVGVHVERDYGSYTSTYSVDGRRLAARRVFELRVRRLSAARAADFMALAATIRADEAQRFEVRALSIDEPALPDNASPAELYSAGSAAFEHRRFAAAAAIYQRVIELDPSHKDGWLALGLALERLDRLDEAEAAMTRQIAVNPFHAQAHRDLGALLVKRQQWARALVAYRRHLDIAPLDGHAAARAGWLAHSQLEYGDAAMWLEKALTLSGPAAWIHMSLGDSLLGLGRREQGIAEVRRALDLEPGPRMLGLAASSFAHWRVDVDDASAWADRAVADATAAVAALPLETFSRDSMPVLHTLAAAWAAKGRALSAEGRLTDAEAWLRSAWTYSGDPNIGEVLGTVYEAHGDRDRAAATYAEAIVQNGAPWPSVNWRLTFVASPETIVRLREEAQNKIPPSRALMLDKGLDAPANGYLAVAFSPTGVITTARRVGGDEALDAAVGRLVGLKVPYDVHPEVGGPIVAPVNLACSPGGCVALFPSFYQVTSGSSAHLRWP